MHAAAIAFYGLLSFGPVILVVLAIGGLVLSGQADLMATIKENLTVLFPAAHNELLDQLTSFVAKSKVFGLVGVVGLLWSGSRVFASLDISLNEVWRVAQTRPYWRHRLLAMGLVPLLLLVFMSSMAITSVYSLITGSQWASNSGLSELPLIADVIRYVIPPILSWAIFFGLYWFLPARRIPARSAIIGSAVAAALWELAKLIFDVFLRNFGRMDTVYGTAAGIVILMLWFYYSAMTFLVGAVVGASDMDRRITQSARRRVRNVKK
jgi:membrane protein